MDLVPGKNIYQVLQLALWKLSHRTGNTSNKIKILRLQHEKVIHYTIVSGGWTKALALAVSLTVPSTPPFVHLEPYLSTYWSD